VAQGPSSKLTCFNAHFDGGGTAFCSPTASEVSLESPYSISSASCKGLSSKKQPSQGQTSLVCISFWEACDNLWFRMNLLDVLLSQCMRASHSNVHLTILTHFKTKFSITVVTGVSCPLLKSEENRQKNFCDFVYFAFLQYLKCLLHCYLNISFLNENFMSD
jgi:hypothetical protein